MGYRSSHQVMLPGHNELGFWMNHQGRVARMAPKVLGGLAILGAGLLAYGVIPDLVRYIHLHRL